MIGLRQILLREREQGANFAVTHEQTRMSHQDALSSIMDQSHLANLMMVRMNSSMLGTIHRSARLERNRETRPRMKDRNARIMLI